MSEKLPNELTETVPRLNQKSIAQKEFKRQFRGYNREEVDTFLEKIIVDYAIMDEHFTNMRNYIGQLEAQVANHEKGQRSTAIGLEDLSEELQDSIKLLNKIVEQQKKRKHK